VTLSHDASHAQLCISDSGTGITDELAERLYQPFSAGDLLHGSGLGLAICHEIVQALSGSIRLNNRLLNGHIQGLNTNVNLPLKDSQHSKT
jgi:two-component system sensor histidine kinase TctE